MWLMWAIDIRATFSEQHNGIPFLYQKLRPVGDMKGQQGDSSWCIPVAPNLSHPLWRRPVRTTLPLIWDDCYLSTFVSIEARAPTFAYDEEPSGIIQLSQAERARLARAMDDDTMTHRSRLSPSELNLLTGDDDSDEVSLYYNASSRKLSSGSEGSSRVPSPIPPQCREKSAEEVVGVRRQRYSTGRGRVVDGDVSNEKQEYGISDDLDANADPVIPKQAPGGSELGVTPSMLRRLMEVHQRKRAEHGPPPREGSFHGSRIHMSDPSMMSKPVVNVSFDLSEVGEVSNDPIDFYRELEDLKQLKLEMEASRKQRELENARKVDEYFANLASQMGPTRRIGSRGTRWLAKLKKGLRSTFTHILYLS
ncbi:hypothetical protein PM082_003906 [Marasmius tenuissimus]|nr:hypothetical protein PM082_003906 [Marasmius tenuissimus]